MRIVLVNGSPKSKDSASEVLLSMLKNHLSGEITEYRWNKPEISEEEARTISESDAVVLAFPLYIDSIPSHLMRCLVQVEASAKKAGIRNNSGINASGVNTPIIYVIVNNGFFQGKQNIPAIECMEHWCRHCGFSFGQAIGVGGGGMLNAIKGIPDGHGPKKGISKCLAEMGANIMGQKPGKNDTLEPDYPAFLYKFQAEYGWRYSAKKNGLKRKDLDRRL